MSRSLFLNIIIYKKLFHSFCIMLLLIFWFYVRGGAIRVLLIIYMDQQINIGKRKNLVYNKYKIPYYKNILLNIYIIFYFFFIIINTCFQSIHDIVSRYHFVSYLILVLITHFQWKMVHRLL